MKQKYKFYLVIGQKETDGEQEILVLTKEEIQKLQLHISPDHCIIDGKILKAFNGNWNLR